jgi:2'-5' RNA ligase
LKVAGEIETIRKELNTLAGSRVALSYPPHITLRTGVIVPETEISDFVREFGQLLYGEKPFPVCTEGIYCGTYEQDGIPQPIVCYLIKKEKPFLALNKKLLSYYKYRKSDRTGFEPHLTIAYEDLTFEGFEKIQNHIANHPELHARTFSWTCNHVGLYVHEADRWQPYHIFSFSNEL